MFCSPLRASQWEFSARFQKQLEEALCSCSVAAALYQDIKDDIVLVDRAP
jgi:hypothetical protein